MTRKRWSTLDRITVAVGSVPPLTIFAVVFISASAVQRLILAGMVITLATIAVVYWRKALSESSDLPQERWYKLSRVAVVAVATTIVAGNSALVYLDGSEIMLELLIVGFVAHAVVVVSAYRLLRPPTAWGTFDEPDDTSPTVAGPWQPKSPSVGQAQAQVAHMRALRRSRRGRK